MSSFWANTKWVDQHTADYLQWKFKNSLKEEDEEFQNAKPGVYICGEFSNDFFTRRAFVLWWKFVTDPFVIGFLAMWGLVTAESAAPKVISKNIFSSVFEALLMSAVLMVVLLIPLIVVDILVMFPITLINVYLSNNRHKLEGLTDEELKFINDGPGRNLMIVAARLLSHN